MTFIELVEAVARTTGSSKRDVKRILKAATSRIELTVVILGGEVKLPGFGRFRQHQTRTGECFGRKNAERITLKFKPYAYRRNTMEKLGVVLEPEMTKTGSIGSQCPKCGSKLQEPNKCRHCGTEPFEKRPESPQPKK